jgi:hypothetical protein
MRIEGEGNSCHLVFLEHLCFMLLSETGIHKVTHHDVAASAPSYNRNASICDNDIHAAVPEANFALLFFSQVPTSL